MDQGPTVQLAGEATKISTVGPLAGRTGEAISSQKCRHRIDGLAKSSCSNTGDGLEEIQVSGSLVVISVKNDITQIKKQQQRCQEGNQA